MSDGQLEMPLGPRLVTRARDLLWESVLEVCGLEQREMTATARGACNRACRDLREVQATPEEVAVRAVEFRRRWPGMTLSPSALAKHWPALRIAQCAPVSDRQVQIQGSISRAIAAAYDDHHGFERPVRPVDVRGEVL